jgi:hypothetical protein
MQFDFLWRGGLFFWPIGFLFRLILRASVCGCGLNRDWFRRTVVRLQHKFRLCGGGDYKGQK